MTILESVLVEEEQRLERNIREYEKMLVSLPKGSLFVRKMGKQSFAYLKRKENNKVISVYLGNVDSDEVKEQIALNEEYKKIRNLIRVAKGELFKLHKALKAYGRN